MLLLDAKHESLRTVYLVDEHGEPRQRLLPPLEHADFDCLPATQEQVQELVDELVRVPFDLRRDRPWRVQALSDPARPAGITRLLLAKHHIAADAWGMDLMITDLRAFLGFGEPVPPAATGSLGAIAHEQRTSRSWRSRAVATERHFRNFYSQPRAPFRNYDPGLPSAQASLESRRLYTAAHNLAEAHEVSTATVMTAAYAFALAEQCDGPTMRIGLLSSNRFAERWEYLVTTMNQLAALLVNADPDRGLPEQLAAVHAGALHAYRLSHYDHDSMTPQALGMGSAPGAEEPLARFNFLTAQPAEYHDEEGPNEPSVHFEPLFKLFDVPCYLRVSETDEEGIRLQALTRGLPEQTVRALLLCTYRVVVDAAAGCG
jgi:hypothetical protein